MLERGREAGLAIAKVVLVGMPGAGKAEIASALAARYPEASLRAGDLGEGRVYRAEFAWPESLPDGRPLRVRVFVVSGHPVYNAVGELVLTGADGIVFVANLARREANGAREALRAVVFNAGRHGMDLAAMPVALQYLRPSAGPAMDGSEMDSQLGIPPGTVSRFVTGDGPGEDPCAAVEWIVADLVKRAKTPPAALDH